MLLAKSAYREVLHTLQPRKVAVVRFEGKPVQENTLLQLGVYLFIYVVILLAGFLLLCLESPDVPTAFTAALTCISNVGPGLNAVGPVENFAFYSAPAKLLLSFLMLAGRLEFYPILILFFTSTWRKN